MVAARVALPVLDIQRPRTRGECERGVGLRPCIFVSCRHHILTTVEHPDGRLEINGEILAVDATPAEVERFTEAIAELAVGMKHTCSLDVAERGEQTLDAVGKLLGVTRERIRQLEGKIIRSHIRRPIERAGLSAVLKD